MLLIERADYPGALAIGDRQPRARRDAARDRGARAARGDRHRRRRLRRRRRLAAVERFRDLSASGDTAIRPGTTHNTEHVFGLEVPEPVPVHARAARASAPCVAAVARGGGALLFMDQSRRDRSAAGARASSGSPHDVDVTSCLDVAAWLGLAPAYPAYAQPITPRAEPAGRDRQRVGHRDAAPTTACTRGCAPKSTTPIRSRAAERGQRADGKALARAKGVKGVEASTTSRIRRTRSPSGTSRCAGASRNRCRSKARTFAALAALVSKMQADDQLVLSGMNFSVSAAARRNRRGRADAAGDQGVAGARAERGARLRRDRAGAPAA